MSLQLVSTGHPLLSVSLHVWDCVYFSLVLLVEVYLSWINGIHIREEELSSWERDDAGPAQAMPSMVAVLESSKITEQG